MDKSPWAPLLALFSLCLACPSTSAGTSPPDRERLMEHVEQITSHGPHPPGSQAQKQVGDYLIGQLRSYGLEVQVQAFQPVTPVGRIEMRNIWGIVQGRRDSVIILASHYDSKYFKDFPFLGANDSGSSSALLLELARVLAADNPSGFTLWFVFFDGEEALLEWTSADSLYGSREFVKRLKQRQEIHKVSALILLDMIGEKDLTLRQDLNSTGWLNEILWEQAEQLGYGRIFQSRGSTGAVDDHLPFAEEGIPVVDLIDLDYAHWHRPEDTVDKLSAENMSIVGHVVLASLPHIAGRLSK